MAKKLTPRSEPQTHGSPPWANYPRQIWLAGLGALALTQEEGSRLFDNLVQRGRELEKDSRQVAGERLHGMRHQVSGTFNKLEQVFQDRVARALNSLGVPTDDDIRALSRRVENLDRHIQSLLNEHKQGDKTDAAA